MNMYIHLARLLGSGEKRDWFLLFGRIEYSWCLSLSHNVMLNCTSVVYMADLKFELILYTLKQLGHNCRFLHCIMKSSCQCVEEYFCSLRVTVVHTPCILCLRSISITQVALFPSSLYSSVYPPLRSINTPCWFLSHEGLLRSIEGHGIICSYWVSWANNALGLQFAVLAFYSGIEWNKSKFLM